MTELGVYLDLRNPPGSGRSAAEVWGSALELVAEAEALGIRSVWLSEHHRFDDGYLPQPLVFAAAAAARTREIRIGTAVLLAPLRSATLLAEEAIAVDLLSEGRLDLGLGSGYRPPEFELFGADFAARYRETDRIAAEVRRMTGDGSLTPPPVQRPIPVWLGYGGPQGARRAGAAGFPLLSANRDLIAPYLEGRASAGLDPAGARMAGHVNIVVSEDPERDWPAARADLAYQADSYNRYAVEGTDLPLPRPSDPDRRRARGIGGTVRHQFFGTPEACAAAIREYTAGTPIETVFTFVTVGRMDHERSREHLRALARAAELVREGSAAVE